jgi:hypothetical protein
MSMDVTDTVTTYVVKKKDNTIAMRITVEYFDLDYEKLVARTGVHLQGLVSQQALGQAEAERRKSK